MPLRRSPRNGSLNVEHLKCDNFVNLVQSTLNSGISELSLRIQRCVPTLLPIPSLRPARPPKSAPDLFSIGTAGPHSDLVEEELVLLTSPSVFSNLYDTKELSRIELTQVYFKRKQCTVLAAEVLRRRGLHGKMDPRGFSRARLRKTNDGSETRYLLQVKTPKRRDPIGTTYRKEVSCEISSSEFQRLLRLPTVGFIRKTRFALPFQLKWRGTSWLMAATADFVRASGPLMEGAMIPREQFAETPPIVITDIELPAEAAATFLNGNHTLALGHAEHTLLSSLSSQDQRALSASRLAKRGFDRRAMRAISRLPLL